MSSIIIFLKNLLPQSNPVKKNDTNPIEGNPTKYLTTTTETVKVIKNKEF